MKILLAFLFSLLCGIASAQTCTTTISTGTSIATALGAAAPGSTICLNSGNWGSLTLNGVVKSNYVTIRSTTGIGASMSITITGGTQYVRLKNLTITGGDINGASTKHIAVMGSSFTSSGLFVNTTGFNANDILISGNTFNGTSTAGFQEGRLSVSWPGGPGSVPAGVTVSFNTFSGGGCSDGVQIGAYGVVVGPGNYFTGLVQGNCTQHVDSIQGYGQSHTVVRGNYFYKPRVCLGFYDGGNTEIIENNVFVGNGGADGGQCVIDLGSMASTSFKHNTVVNASVRVGGINSSTGGSGTYTENVMQGSSFNSGPLSSCSSCSFTHNLSGSPTYLGGSAPTVWSTWRIAPGSIGKGASVDGTDQGSLYFNPAAPGSIRVN